MENTTNPNPPQSEENRTQIFLEIASVIEQNDQIDPQQNVLGVCREFLLMAKTDALIIAIIKCISVYVKKGINYSYEAINKGVYKILLLLSNPRESYPKISIEVAIEARHAIMEIYQFKNIASSLSVAPFTFSIFVSNFFKFPLVEQRKLIEISKNISTYFSCDDCSSSFIQISQILTHFDLKIVNDAASILFNSFNLGNSRNLKVVDPIIARNISISLEAITDISIISKLLNTLCKICQVSYEYAEQIINVPIDFGLIINNIGNDPRSDLVNLILKIIHQIFSYQTLRKGEDRNSKLSKFAFYVQPVLIKLIKQNLGDINLSLECLSDTLDVYVPFNEINNILDAIANVISFGNKNLKVESFLKKLIENQKIKEAMNQYDNLKIPDQSPITHITNFKSFIDASNLRLSTFAINESLQKSILKLLKSIKSSKSIEKSLSTENYNLMQESLVKIVNICQKMLILNTQKPDFKSEETMLEELKTNQIRITLFDQSGKAIYVDIPIAMNLSACEIFFNYMQQNAPQMPYVEIPTSAHGNAIMYVNMNNMKDLINITHINNTAKTSLINHLLCYQSNKRFTSVPKNAEYYKYYYFKSQGKVYSVFDNIYHATNESNQLELIEIQKTEEKPTEQDFMNRSDIKHKKEENKGSIINFAAFHETFYLAYPTLNLQKRSFDYYSKIELPVIETILQILKEIYRLFPNLRSQQNNDNIFKNIFENEIFGRRLIENFDLKSAFSTRFITSSTFINFPFLFTFEQRLIFLKVTSLSHFQIYYTLVSDVIKDENKTIPYQSINLNIDKSRIFEEGLSVFNLLSPGSIFYDVKFKDEIGFGKGPTQEFFRLFAIEMQSNSLDIWLSDNYEKNSYAYREGERGLFPSPRSVCRPDLFFTLGALCAKAIEMGFTIPLHFSPAFIKLLRGERVELEEVSSTYAKSMQDKKGFIGLYFTLPGRDDIELRNGGKVIVTDDGNVDLYLELLRRTLTFDVFNNEDDEAPLTPVSSKAWQSLQKASSNTLNYKDAPQRSLRRTVSSSSSSSSYVQIRRAYSNNRITEPPSHSDTYSSANFLTETEIESSEDESTEIPEEIADYIERYSFECCASMFREGFGRIIPWSAMNLFTPEEICCLIEGDDDLSMHSLKENIIIGAGYESNSPQILWLFDIVSNELSPMEKKLFIRFLVGGDSFGVFGLKSIRPRLSISKSEKGESALPSASTCSNSLKLPEYSSKEILKKKLLYAIHECNESFYL